MFLCLAVLGGSTAGLVDPRAGLVVSVILVAPALLTILTGLVSWLGNTTVRKQRKEVEMLASEVSYKRGAQDEERSYASLFDSTLGSSFRRGVFVGIVLFLWLGIPLSLLRLELGFSQYWFLNFVFGVWFASVVSNAFPATGIIAGVIGLISRDRLVSFLIGFLPNLTFVLLEIKYAGPSSEEFSSPLGYAIWDAILGLCYGLIGLGGALYATWETNPLKAGQTTMRRGVLFGFFGFYLWFIVAWGNILGFPRP